MVDPFRPRVIDGQLFGRGALDMKGGLAAIMAVGAHPPQERPPAGDVIIAAVVDEEWGSAGTEALIGSRRADGAIVTEPTNLRVCVAHKGFTSFEISTRGVAAHGSRPDLGVDAIAKMGPILAGLDELDRDRGSGPAHPLLGRGSIHAGVISGGVGDSVYPGRCCVTIERRRVPGETARAAKEELAGLVARCRAQDARLEASVETTFSREPFQADSASSIVITLQAELADARADADPVGVPYWTDAALLQTAGIPSVVFGPTGAGEHAVDEHVDIDSIVVCAETILSTARRFCG